jgi:hypothetical protein
MSESNNGLALSPTDDARPRYTGELLLRTRPNVYRQIVRLLSEGVSANQICKRCQRKDSPVTEPTRCVYLLGYSA